MKEKIIAMLMVTLLGVISLMPVTTCDTTVTGTFTPSSSGVSITCNNTTPSFGSIALGGNNEVSFINVSNNGDTNCTVTMTAGEGPGTWTLVSGTSSPATTNEFCVNMDPNDAVYADVFTEQTISSDLSPPGTVVYYTKFDLKVFVSSFTDEGSPGEQTFYANLTAAALT